MQINHKNQMCGLELLKRIKPNSVTCTFFDPQYRSILDKMKFGNEGKRQKERSELPQMPDEMITEFLELIALTLKPSGHLFMWVDKFMLVEGFKIPDSLERVDLITWHKKTFGMGKRTRRVCEYVVILQKKPKRVKDCWTLHNIPDVWIEKIEKHERKHCHQKPLGMIAALIEAVTNEGDLICDPCAGSFNVMDVAMIRKRNFIGCDILGAK